jgi:hypothetical protein
MRCDPLIDERARDEATDRYVAWREEWRRRARCL